MAESRVLETILGAGLDRARERQARQNLPPCVRFCGDRVENRSACSRVLPEKSLAEHGDLSVAKK